MNGGSNVQIQTWVGARRAEREGGGGAQRTRACAGARCEKQKRGCKALNLRKHATACKRTTLDTLAKGGQLWIHWVSIPIPLACEASALPSELCTLNAAHFEHSFLLGF